MKRILSILLVGCLLVSGCNADKVVEVDSNTDKQYSTVQDTEGSLTASEVVDAEMPSTDSMDASSFLKPGELAISGYTSGIFSEIGRILGVKRYAEIAEVSSYSADGRSTDIEDYMHTFADNQSIEVPICYEGEFTAPSNWESVFDISCNVLGEKWYWDGGDYYAFDIQLDVTNVSDNNGVSGLELDIMVKDNETGEYLSGALITKSEHPLGEATTEIASFRHKVEDVSELKTLDNYTVTVYAKPVWNPPCNLYKDFYKLGWSIKDEDSYSTELITGSDGKLYGTVIHVENCSMDKVYTYGYKFTDAAGKSFYDCSFVNDYYNDGFLSTGDEGYILVEAPGGDWVDAKVVVLERSFTPSLDFVEDIDVMASAKSTRDQMFPAEGYTPTAYFDKSENLCITKEYHSGSRYGIPFIIDYKEDGTVQLFNNPDDGGTRFYHYRGKSHPLDHAYGDIDWDWNWYDLEGRLGTDESFDVTVYVHLGLDFNIRDPNYTIYYG